MKFVEKSHHSKRRGRMGPRNSFFFLNFFLINENNMHTIIMR